MGRKRTCALFSFESVAVSQERQGAAWELKSKDQISKCGILMGICYRQSDQKEKVDQASF